MSFLYKDYCFNTIAEVADRIVAEVFDGGGGFVDHVVVFQSTIDVYAAPDPAPASYTVTPPDCSPLGYKPWIVAEWAEVSLLLGAMSLVIVTAWAGKMAKLSLKS